ncbi:serpin B13-like isoform X1 [Ochotona curzoniae]|uniref:serpin B13-like isoform X1 n=1 Tax=Ochotona curzoniae TaxID=130825 RepID=UPI001B34AF7B|nr:serpin B13-like isoform X1 [Ochotona curzoniae]
MESLGAANIQFGFDLFKVLKKTENGNVFFSPVGISTAIGMILLGTRGATASQLQKVFHFAKDTEDSRIKTREKEDIRLKHGKRIGETEEIHQYFQKLLTDIDKLGNEGELNITNRLFGEKTYLFLQKYLDYVEKYYHASLEPVDFLNAPDETRKKINSWVESQTNERIKDLFPDGSLSSATKLVLINTVYFKGQWDRAFKKEDTKEEEFWLNKSTSKTVLMMTQRHPFSFMLPEDLPAKILGIPYKNNGLQMFVLLPDDIDGLEKIIDRITPEKLVEWTSPGHMEEKNVNLRLPRLEVEGSYDLGPVLSTVGLEDAFVESNADCSVSSLSGLHADKLLHRSFVAITEEGTEAAAATGIRFNVSSASAYEDFHCNHPFLFFIRHSDSNSILFFGKFSSP